MAPPRNIQTIEMAYLLKLKLNTKKKIIYNKHSIDIDQEGRLNDANSSSPQF